MKTPHLDNLINDLKAYDRNNMLSDNGRNQLNEYETIKQALSLHNVVEQSEQLKAEVFTLANKLALAGEGDAAVAMHRIHNRL